ncbi:MAG: hypothetical protein COA79_08885 [Planctomycetota bacterium]|nr:MAG: hypothetical protein COA79_08885 [Planctomycetota bacterium]
MNHFKSIKLICDIALINHELNKEWFQKSELDEWSTPLDCSVTLLEEFNLSSLQIRTLLLDHLVEVFKQNQVFLGQFFIEQKLISHSLLGKALEHPNDSRLLLSDLLKKTGVFSPERIKALNKIQLLLLHDLQINNQFDVTCPGCNKLFLIKELNNSAEWKCDGCFFKFNISGLLADLPNDIIQKVIQDKKVTQLIALSNKETLSDKSKNEISEDDATVDVSFFSSNELVEEISKTGRPSQSSVPQSLRSFLIQNNLTPNADLVSDDSLNEISGDFSRYAVGREIGRGGMGSILKTKDLDTRRNIVTKVMHQKTSKKGILRFIEEAQVTAQLEHPNIVPVYDLGVNAEGNVFYTMKHVKGRSLQDILNKLLVDQKETREKFPPNKLIDVLLSVCNAVSYAHSQHVIHRDLKPENIMVGEYGEVLLMDFGLAKILSHKQDRNPVEENRSVDIVTSDRSEQEDMATLEGDITGTPRYMAPEQARGDTSELDEHTDLYALGGILHACFSFEPPVGGSKLNEIIKNVQEGIRLPLPDSAPSEIKAIVAKAMQLKKKDRYASVNDFANDLELFQNGFQVSVKVDNPIVVLLKLIKRNKSIFTTIVIGLCLLSFFGFFSIRKIIDEKNEAEKNLNLFKEEQNIVSGMKNERIKPWKTFYKSTFKKELKEHKIKGRPEDFGYGPWALHRVISKVDQSKDLDEVKRKWNSKVLIKDNRLHFSSEGDGYCYLNKPVTGNLRLKTGVEIIEGYWPEATFFICGSKEKQELDGYSMIIGRALKFQRKGNMILTFPLKKMVKPGRKVKILFEKIDNVLKGYIDDLTTPIFTWEDPEPLYGKKHEICGMYVWRGEIAIDSFEISKELLAKRNTPLDFVNSIQDKGHFQYAIDEYYEIIFSSSDQETKAQSYFNIGITHKKSKKSKLAREIFNQFILLDKVEVNGQVINFKKSKNLKAKAYIYNLLISIDKEFDELDIELKNWPKKLKHDYEQVLIHSKTQPAMLIVFNYVIARKVKMYQKADESKKVIKFMELLFQNMSPASKLKSKKSFSEYIFMVGLQEYYKKKHQACVDFMSKAIFYNDNDSRFYYNRGLNLELLHREDDALKDFKKIIELAPTERRGYMTVSRAYGIQGDHNKSIDVLKKGIKAIPSSGLLYAFLASSYLSLNKELKAIEAYKQGIQMEPGMARNYLRLGELYLKKNEIIKVNPLIMKAMKYAKNQPNTYELSGLYEERIGNGEKAVEHYLKAMSFDAHNLMLIIKIYNIYKKKKMYEKGMTYLKRGLKRQPKNNECLILEVDCLIGLQQKDVAEKKLKFLEVKLKNNKKYEKDIFKLKKLLLKL